MKMKKLKFITLAIFAVIAIYCSQCDDDTFIDTNDILPYSDTIDFRLINTNDLVHCMLVKNVELKKDSFLIKSETELENNFTSNSCINSIPDINFTDSIIIGYKIHIGSDSKNSQLLLTYDSLKHILVYTITAFENDTPMMITELNWITVLNYDIDSITFKLNIVFQ